MKRRAGTYNRQDPTAYVRWTWGHLTLHDVTWGVEVQWRGRRIAWDTRWARWAMAGLEDAQLRYELQFDDDPMGRLSDYQ